MMKLRAFLKIAGAGMVLGVSMLGRCAEPVSQSPGKAAAGRPNLVFVFSDQQSFDMLGCAGNKCVSREASRPNAGLDGEIRGYWDGLQGSDGARHG